MSALTGKITYTLRSVTTGREYPDDGTAPVPGTYETIPRTGSMDQPMGMGAGCVTGIGFRWDQWVVCTITCGHKVYEGVSRYFNVTEALIAAIGEFNCDDHPAVSEDVPETS
jgi:hypothetical protein